MNINRIWIKERFKRAKEQNRAIYNVERLYKTRDIIIKFFDDYSSLVYEAKYNAINWEELKILAPKQVL